MNLLHIIGGAIGSFLSNIGKAIMIYVIGKKSGRQEATIDNLEEGHEAAKKRARTDAEVAGMSDDALDAELRKDQRSHK